MSRRTHTKFPSRKHIGLPLFAALSILLAACGEPETPQGPSVVPSLKRAAKPIGTIVVNVLNTAVTGPAGAGFTASAINFDIVPFAAGQTVSRAVTDADGVATLSKLIVPGSYCVIVTAGSGVPGQQVPPPGGEPPELLTNTGSAVITGADLESNPVNEATWEECLNDPPITLKNKRPRDVTLTLQPFATLSATFQTPGGVTPPAFALLELPASLVPYVPAGLAPDFRIGILLALNVATSPPSLFVPPGLSGVTLESGFVTDAFGTQTGTEDLTTPTPTAGNSADVGGFTNLLMCTKTTQADPVSGHKVDFTKVTYGFLADGSLNRLQSVAIIVDHTVDDAEDARVDLKVRNNRPAKTDNLETSWTCPAGGGDCFAGPQKGSLTKKPGFSASFFAIRDAGSVTAKWSLLSLVSDDTEFSVHTPAGEFFPKDPKPGESSGFRLIPVPPECIAGQSNDDRWFIGN